MIQNLAALRTRMNDHEPKLVGGARRQHAAVALVLREVGDAIPPMPWHTDL